MNTQLTIKPIHNEYCDEVIDLILSIQQKEFNLPITIDAQPDLRDIDANYHKDGGNFWGAFSGDKLVGTIALINSGQEMGTIRKMFVKKEYRGKELGIAQQLLETLLQYCQDKAITDIYLGTVDQLKAAHRFYERNGFAPIAINNIPSYFPRMLTDNLFYYLNLNK
jgi:GNAT superfamily N-acetyltransferase